MTKIKDIIFTALKKHGLSWEHVTHCSRPQEYLELEDNPNRFATQDKEFARYGHKSLLMFAAKDNKFYYISYVTHYNFFEGNTTELTSFEIDSLPDEDVWNKSMKVNYKKYLVN